MSVCVLMATIFHLRHTEYSFLLLLKIHNIQIIWGYGGLMASYLLKDAQLVDSKRDEMKMLHLASINVIFVKQKKNTHKFIIRKCS